MQTQSVVKSRVIRIAASVLLWIAATPAFAQFQMPDPKEMSGLPRPVNDLPDGAISVRLIRGQLSNNIVDHPVELHAGDKVQTVKTDETGRAQFQGVAAGTMVHAVATVDGERIESREFAVPASGGIRLILVATDKGAAKPAPALPPQSGIVVLGASSRIVVEATDDGPQVFYLLDIENTARAPVNPPKPFVMDLPPAATSATLMEGSSPQALLKGHQLTVNGPFAPGRTLVQVALMFGATRNLTIAQSFPAQLEQLSVIVRKIGDVAVSSRQISKTEDVTADGQTYVMGSGPAVAAGSPITVEISGLPSHSAAPRYAAILLAMVIVSAGVWASMAPKKPSAAAARRQHLEARREKLFADLVRVEQQRRAGTIPPDQYANRRHTLVAQLERVYGELDQRGGVRGGSEGLAA